MALTRDFTSTIKARADKDPKFRIGLLIEAAECFLNGDVDTGKTLLRRLRERNHRLSGAGEAAG